MPSGGSPIKSATMSPAARAAPSVSADHSIESARRPFQYSVSGGIDLAICRLRVDDVGAAERVLDEVTAAASGASGFHDWLWAMRLAWARAEIAAARRDRDGVERWAAETLTMAAGCRPKYEVAALVTRARVRTGHAALADLDRAVALARPLGDPALLVRAARPRLALDGSDALAAEVREAEATIRTARPT